MKQNTFYLKVDKFSTATKRIRRLKGFWKTNLLLFKIWLFFSAFVLHIYLGLQVYFVCASSNVEWWITSYVLIVLISIITVYFVLFRERTLKNLWKNLFEYLILTHDVQAFSKKCKYVVFGATLYLLIIEACSIITAMKVRPNQLTLEMDVVCPKCSHFNFSRSTLSSIIIADYSLYALCVLGSLTVYPIFFSLTCMMVTKFVDSYLHLLRQVKNRGQPLTLSDVQLLRREFQRISSVTQAVNRVFSNLVFLWYVFSVVIACQGITFVLTSLDEVDNWYSMVYYIPLYFQCLFVLIVVTIVGAKIPEKVEEAFIFVQDLTNFNYPDTEARKLESCVYQELNLLMTQMTTPTTGLTAGGCFLITKTFCVSFLGAATTYCIILIQLNPDIQEKLKQKL